MNAYCSEFVRSTQVHEQNCALLILKHVNHSHYFHEECVTIISIKYHARFYVIRILQHIELCVEGMVKEYNSLPSYLMYNNTDDLL